MAKRKSEPFAMLLHRVIYSPQYAALPPQAVRLLNVACCLWNGANNGRIALTLAHVERFGIKSAVTLRVALKALQDAGFIFRTRSHGIDGVGRNTPALYALTFQPMTRNTTGLFIHGFKKDAFEHIAASETPPKKQASKKNMGDKKYHSPMTKTVSSDPKTGGLPVSKNSTFIDIAIYGGEKTPEGERKKQTGKPVIQTAPKASKGAPKNFGPNATRAAQSIFGYAPRT